jgi:hypothetical protein
MHHKPHAFIYHTHIVSKKIIAEYKKIDKACQDFGEAWLIYQGSEKNPLLEQNEVRVYQCTIDDIKSLGYPLIGSSIFPGMCHYPLVHFYKNHPDYVYYWHIEYDVRFRGNWRTLFDAFDNVNADLIAAHFARYSEEPDWPLWKLLHPRLSIPLEQRWRCFHPIYRISNRALEFLCEAHQDGWMGHSEVLIPTLLLKNDFSLMDFGGRGAYVPQGMENKFYTGRSPNPAGLLDEGTLRWRPNHMWTGFRWNKIYHPVKVK